MTKRLFLLWMRPEWQWEWDLAAQLAGRFDDGARFADILADPAFAFLSAQHLWTWRRRYDEFCTLRKKAEAAFGRFGETLSDALAVRLAHATPDFPWRPAPAHWMETARALFLTAMKESDVRFAAVGRVHASFEELLVFHAPPADWPAHRVLCALRGVLAGALRLCVRLPEEALARQWELRRGVWPDDGLSFLRGALPGLVWEEMTARARREAVEAAAAVYRGLLEAPKLDVSSGVLGIAVGAVHSPAGAVFRHRDGRWDARVFPADEEGFSQLMAWCESHPDTPVVLPSSAADHRRLQQLQQAFSRRFLTLVRPAGISWSRRELPVRMPAPAASARVLVERAMDPMGTWPRIPAARLGLAEYQPEIPQEWLQAAFDDMVEWVSRERTSARAQPAVAGVRPAPAPLVRSMSDLRPGMQIPGVVTSIVPFGAFVNIGMEVDGFIHVSELSSGFVSDPALVLQLGQRVLCRVLEVDLGRRRISLSLRPASPTPPARANARRQLEKLDSLFRK